MRAAPWILGLAGAGAFAALLAMEIWTADGPTSPLKLLLEAIEIGLMIIAAGGITLLVNQLRAQREERLTLIRDLETARRDGQTWRARVQSHLDGLGAAIDRQLDAWALTAAEKEVALLMLKGFSHKEIGVLRKTSEATARQQAGAIYAKSGLASRAAFCAFFLEDFLPEAPANPPPTERPPRHRSG